MQKMGRAHNNSIHILIGLKELAPDLAILAARACLGEARHTVCKDELLLLHCSGMLLAAVAQGSLAYLLLQSCTHKQSTRQVTQVMPFIKTKTSCAAVLAFKATHTSSKFDTPTSVCCTCC